MAHAFDPDDPDPRFRLTRNSDEAWRTDLALIREIIRQERQAEEDRALAASLAGITLHQASDDIRRMAMLFSHYDDDDDDEDDSDTEDFIYVETDNPGDNNNEVKEPGMFNFSLSSLV